MAKQVQGSCNRCGHCGCYAGAGGHDKWYPGIGGSHMEYGAMYPDRDTDICALIRAAFMATEGRKWDKDYDQTISIRIAGGGPPLDVDCYITQRGIQKSASDASCPFFALGTPNECILWGRAQLPPSCANYPQTFQYLPNGEGLIAKWEANHPHTGSGGLCGYYWIDV